MTSNDSEELTELLARVARHDRPAFARLYRLQAPHLYRILQHILKQEALAEEALQDVFVKIWQRAGDYRSDRGAPSTWLGSIARYRAFDMLRRNRHAAAEFSAPDDLADANPGPLETFAATAGHARLHECLELLKSEQRSCVVLCYCEGYTQEELSRRLDRPLGTIKSWIRRGLERLRQCLGG